MARIHGGFWNPWSCLRNNFRTHGHTDSYVDADSIGDYTDSDTNSDFDYCAN